MNAFRITGARVIDPASGSDEGRDLFVRDGLICGKSPEAESWPSIQAKGWVACPGLIDIHVHLREPGRPDKETIQTGAAAAAAGGFTTIVAMPNTTPPADSASVVAWMQQRAAEAPVRVLFSGCISQGMKGELPAPYASLKKAGVVALTDDGRCVQNADLMRRAVEHAKMFDLPILDHCEDTALSAGGVMNEGYWSMVLGLPGWPAIAEEIIIARNALLSELTGHRIHCQHVTTAGGVRIIREARERGVLISGEATPHHIALTDASLQNYDTRFKMNPPLRTRRDTEALILGLQDGTIDILATDHAPHCGFEKEVEFEEAPFGIVGLETALGLFLTHLHHKAGLPLSKILKMLTVNPAKLLNIPSGTLAEGQPADITLFDPSEEWTVDASQFRSRSRNTPFDGTRLQGRQKMTIVGGKIVWQQT